MRQFLMVLLIATFGPLAQAANDGSDIPACAGVTDKCMNADVTSKDSKTGRQVKGYQPGEHGRDQKGLWVDCVAPLAHGASVSGVTGVSKDAAKACLKAKRAAKGK